jgi:hypothetical protein
VTFYLCAYRAGTHNSVYVNYDNNADIKCGQNHTSTPQIHQHQPLLDPIKPKLYTVDPAILTRNRILNICYAPLEIAKFLPLARAVRIKVERRLRWLALVNAPRRLQNKARFGTAHLKSSTPQRYPAAQGIQLCQC